MVRWKVVNGLPTGGPSYACMIFSAIENVFGHSKSVFSFGRHLWRMGHLQSKLQRLFSLNSGFYKDSDRGYSLPHVFPLPPLVNKGGVEQYTMGSMSTGDHLTLVRGCNIVQSVLNMLHGGYHSDVKFVTAAQKRVQARVWAGLESMLMNFKPLEEDTIQEFLKHRQHYAGGGVAIPLGERGGVPASAATVDLRECFEGSFPEFAKQVEEPSSLLLPSRLRPKLIKRGHTWLHRSYPNLVRKNVKAGLHQLKKPSQVAKHRGKLCITGAFAVPKDDKEDRVITDPAVNQLIDPLKLPRPRFAYIPKLRVTLVPKTGKILISKRDARHYFHSLKIGRKWHKWLCGPPIILDGGSLRYPASCTAPMGFGPSAGWAQAVTDLATQEANMPHDKRLHPDYHAPAELPIWGSICDDIWAVEFAGGSNDDAVGPRWLGSAEQAWKSIGVKPNEKKSVNVSEDEEIQGLYVDADVHWVGVKMEKRQALFQAAFYLLQKPRVLVADVERLVGKFGFCHSCRPPMRSVFTAVYPWLQRARTGKQHILSWDDDVWIEIMVAALLLPYCQFNLSSPFSRRVECSDSSMTGIGRAWTAMPTDLVQLMAQLCDNNGTYTNLSLPHGIGLTEEHTCPLKKLQFPHKRFHWHKIGARANPKYIYLGEADAAVWTAEDRLRRPGDDGCRFVHPMDSASCVGAFMKGRSASILLNQRCRKLCAIAVAGGHEVFYPWIPSGDNPADGPSRQYETQAGESNDAPKEQPLASETIIVDPFTLRAWTGNEMFFVHLCSGAWREDDLSSWVEFLASAEGIHIVCVRVDPLVKLDSNTIPCNDLLVTEQALALLRCIQSGRVLGMFASPPCSTFSAARHKRLAPGEWGPRPLRHRDQVWYPQKGLTAREKLATYVGSILALICIGLLGEARMQGTWIGFEHPHDRGHKPFPSVFNSDEMRQLISKFRLQYVRIDQCMFGAPTRKPTGLVLPKGSGEIVRVCTHGYTHEMLAGYDAVTKQFRTTQAAKYPSGLSQSIAQLFVSRLVAAQDRGYVKPFSPQKIVVSTGGVEPWTLQGRTFWEWPSPSRTFLVECLERCHQGKVSACNVAPQS